MSLFEELFIDFFIRLFLDFWLFFNLFDLCLWPRRTSSPLGPHLFHDLLP